MNQTILGLAVTVAVMGATVARADDCGPQPSYAPQGQSWNQGSYQLQTQQVWVPGQTQQVWMPGSCRSFQTGYGVYVQRCSQGHYRTIQTAGRYENRQEWVWVANSYDYGYGRNRQYGRNGNGNGYGHRRNGRHGAVPIGY